ncbi:MAG TPA: P-loop NTPase fold protein, partial [Paludibacter sp.]|nr:P-loop NTPase fold protein [Paludibacter sp.]
PHNNRILFSGMFGIGKTYFLDSFFKNELYEPFFISPINYSVSNNEDILEYIKYDILISLLEKDNISWEKVTFSDDLLVQYYLKDNFWKLAGDVIKHVGKVGKAISTAISDLEKHKIEYEKYKKTYETDDLDTVKNYLSKLLDKEGSIYENNDITTLIYALIKSIPADKKPILIIDDLDRIDPEHIFRILNVFSAHFSKDYESHKFGFEKIILVCDLNNIRNIFQHKYGSGVDFSGYIDKFYSIEPFQFDNKKEIISRIDNFTETIKRERNNNDYFTISRIVLKMFVEYDLINLRKFVDKIDTHWTIPFRKYHEIHNKMRDSSNLIDFLLFMFGNSKEDLCNCLKSRKDEINLERNEYNCFRFICALVNIDKYDKRAENITYINEELNFKINYIITDVNSYEIDIKLEDPVYLNGDKRETIPFFQLLGIAIENYCEITNRYQLRYL